MTPRRLLIIIIGFLWLLTGGLWAWVQLTPPPAPPPVQTLLTAYCGKNDAPKKIAKALESAKIPFEIVPDQDWKHPVQEGFLVVCTIKSEGTRKALLPGMKVLGSVKIVGEDIRLGGPYKAKPAAVKIQKTAKAKGFDFQVVDNIVEKTSKTTALRLGPLTPEQLTLAEETLRKSGLKPDQMVSEEASAPKVSPAVSATPK